MEQAARSGVQNIAEGSQASGTSKKMELKLTNVARASLEELCLDLGKSQTDKLGASMAVVEVAGDWRSFLAEATGGEGEEIEKRLSAGRPGGAEEFIDRLETLTGRTLRPGVGGWPAGRPRKKKRN